uniref:NADH-ubiquinone oxidoreductase chain 3 n=1 Tax=Euseius sacchari TaxID=3061191 RepID=A0AAU6PCM6_9ACAR
MSKFILTSLICMVLFSVSWISTMNFKNKNKLYSFECGFNPFFSPQTPFSIQFFKILLIFLLFDMEIIIILPLPFFTATTTYLNIMITLIIILLLLSLLFEWKEGSLQWIN